MFGILETESLAETPLTFCMLTCLEEYIFTCIFVSLFWWRYYSVSWRHIYLRTYSALLTLCDFDMLYFIYNDVSQHYYLQDISVQIMLVHAIFGWVQLLPLMEIKFLWTSRIKDIWMAKLKLRILAECRQKNLQMDMVKQDNGDKFVIIRAICNTLLIHNMFCAKHKITYRNQWKHTYTFLME